MSLTLNVEVSRKVGLPNYASAGASCGLHINLDPLVARDETILEGRIREAFDICRRAVDGELADFRSAETVAGLPPAKDAGADAQCLCLDDTRVPVVTSRQLDFLDHLARQIRALGGQRLKLLAEHLYGRPLAELSAAQASQLIDLLKELRAGTRNVDELLPQAPV